MEPIKRILEIQEKGADLTTIDDVPLILELLCRFINTNPSAQDIIKDNDLFMVLEFINIDVTSRCNLRCKMCFDQEKRIEKEMSFDDLKKLIFSAIVLGVKRVNLSGGEPFLRNDLIDLLFFQLL